MLYQQAISFLDSFYNSEKHSFASKRFRNLDRIKELARVFGDPHLKYNTVHVTGTKGKGSTAAIIASILTAAGFRTGLYTSPHIVDPRERIVLNGKMIKKEEYARLITKLKNKISLLGPGFRPSFFEIHTILAFNYFAEKKADFAVIEVGMGGRWDATNIILPEVCVITQVSMDHVKELGPKLKDIAAEKAEIIKTGAICVSSVQRPEVAKVIVDKCRKVRVPVYLSGKHFSYKEVSGDHRSETMDITGPVDAYKKIKVSLAGRHQLENCATAIAAIQGLIVKGFDIRRGAIIKGAKNVHVRGRCEVVSRKPFVIIDTAHNGASMKTLRETIRRNFGARKAVFIFGASRDKNIRDMLKEILPAAKDIILTKADSPRAEEPANIAKLIPGRNVILAENIKSAYNIALSLAGKTGMIVITGSFYLAGDAFRGLNIKE